jgi:hypothetical protein
VLAKLYKRCKVRSRAAGQAAPCRESAVSPGTCVWCYCRLEGDVGPAAIGSVHSPVAALYRAAKRKLDEHRQTEPYDLHALQSHVDRLYRLAELESREHPPVTIDHDAPLRVDPPLIGKPRPPT